MSDGTATKIDADLAELDSIKPLLAQSAQPRGNGGFVFGEPIDPVRMYGQSLELYRQKIALNTQMKYLNSFELIKPCIVTRKPYWPRLTWLFLLFETMVVIYLCITNNKAVRTERQIALGQGL